jgi:23S rRNA (cytidine1920-2'-O)/16S rRNA (cytidine1409-2'-O)-methyltransferase
MSQRADIALVDRGFFESRAKARAAIEAGLVQVDGVAVRKPSEPVGEDAKLEASAPHPWVSRAGLKLVAGLDHFEVSAKDRICMDVGSSTGGFTQVLLARGAAQVYAVDVGRDQLHASLRKDPRITVMESTDARRLTRVLVPQAPSLVVCDASFISLRLVLSTSLYLAAAQADLIALIKPQFEAGPARVKKGIVRDADVHAEVCEDIRIFIEGLGWRVRGLVPSPIEGGDGNREFLIAATRGELP